MRLYFEFWKINNEFVIKNSKEEIVLTISKDFKLSLLDVFNALFKDNLITDQLLLVEFVNQTDEYDEQDFALYTILHALITDVKDIINGFISPYLDPLDQ